MFAQSSYDLLLKGGHVIDGKNKISAVRDVAIVDGRIAEVAADIPAAKAAKVVDVSGLFVVPGLVDMHVHVYAGTGQRGAYCGDNSVYPDGFTFRSGVTTVADAGSSGWRNFPDFKDRVIDRAKTRVLAFINIVGKGMGGAVEQDTGDMDAHRPPGRRSIIRMSSSALKPRTTPVPNGPRSSTRWKPARWPISL
jgi:dihydroorotase